MNHLQVPDAPHDENAEDGAGEEAPGFTKCCRICLRVLGGLLATTAAVLCVLLVLDSFTQKVNFSEKHKTQARIVSAASAIFALLLLVISCAPSEEDMLDGELDNHDVEHGPRQSAVEITPEIAEAAREFVEAEEAAPEESEGSSSVSEASVPAPASEASVPEPAPEAPVPEPAPVPRHPDPQSEFQHPRKSIADFADRSFGRMPQFDFFKNAVEALAREIHQDFNPKALYKPVMFIAKKWKKHKRIFKREKPETFWSKNLASMTTRVEEVLGIPKQNPCPRGTVLAPVAMAKLNRSRAPPARAPNPAPSRGRNAAAPAAFSPHLG